MIPFNLDIHWTYHFTPAPLTLFVFVFCSFWQLHLGATGHPLATDLVTKITLCAHSRSEALRMGPPLKSFHCSESLLMMNLLISWGSWKHTWKGVRQEGQKTSPAFGEGRSHWAASCPLAPQHFPPWAFWLHGRLRTPSPTPGGCSRPSRKLRKSLWRGPF